MKRRIPLTRIAALAALCGWLGLVGGAAAEVRPEGWAYELANYLMSPFCPGRTLADCTSPQAESLRMWLVIQEAAGRDRAEVERELLERYGDVMRPAPKADGFGTTAYLFPVVAFVAGGAFIALFLRRQTRAVPAEPAAPPQAPLDPELERIIDEEMAS